MRKLLIILGVILSTSCSKDSAAPEEEVTRYSVNVNVAPVNSGIVNPESAIINANQTIVIKASPSVGFEFVKWTGDWTSTDSEISLVVTKNLSLTANFTSDSDGDGVLNSFDECPNTTLGKRVDSKGCETPLYLSENGKTIIAEDWAVEGQSYFLADVEYLVVSEEMLRELIDEEQDYSHVCVSKVTNMDQLFYLHVNTPRPINYDITHWDVSSVESMLEMFVGNSINQDLSSWDVGNVKDMSGMFWGTPFNQPVGNWNVSSVEDMSLMFYRSSFNKDISSWNVSSVAKMWGMFKFSSFNGNISNWDVGNVVTMHEMFMGSETFGGGNFNQDIGAWDTSNVTDMVRMFKDTSYNKDLSSWNTNNVISCEGFADGNEIWEAQNKPSFANCTPN